MTAIISYCVPGARGRPDASDRLDELDPSGEREWWIPIDGLATEPADRLGVTIQLEVQLNQAHRKRAGVGSRATWRTGLGAAPLAQRARDELRATGAHPRREAVDGVEWHLSRVYSKLGISGRAELDPALIASEREPRS